MYENMNDALKIIWMDEGRQKLSDAMKEMNVRMIRRYPMFKDNEERNQKVDEKDAVRLCGCIEDALEGVAKLDDLIEELKWIRGGLVESVLEMRNAYRCTGCRDAIMRLAELSKQESPCSKSVRSAFAELLGFSELPEQFVNVKAIGSRMDEYTCVTFGVADRPTTATVVIPVEIDYGKDYKIPNEIEELAQYSRELLSDKAGPHIKMFVSLGAVSHAGEYCVNTTDDISCVCRSVQELRDKIDKVVGLDVIGKMKWIEDIRDVKTVEDFSYWRGLRSARAAAERNRKGA